MPRCRIADMTAASNDTPDVPSPEESRSAAAARLAWPLVWTALAVAFFLYVWLRIDPALVYHTYWVRVNIGLGIPVFSLSAPFLRRFLLYPGGPVEGAAALLAQFYQYPWLGAAIITLVTAVLCFAAFVMLRAFGARRVRVLHLLPALLMLALHDLYYDPLPVALALAVALLCACLYGSLPRRTIAARPIAFVVLSVPLYCAAGGAYLVYALLCAMLELQVRRRYAAGLFCLACGAALPYLAGAQLFLISVGAAYGRLLPFRARYELWQRVLGTALYAYFPLAAAAVFVWIRYWNRSPARAPAGGGARVALRVGGVVLFAALAAATARFTFDGTLRKVVAVDYCASRRMWPEVLENARDLPPESYQFFTNSDVDRALCHLGRMPDEMFSYRQHPLGLLLGTEALPSLLLRHRAWVKLSDILFDLGCINESEHLAYEAMEFFGDHPRLLKRVALIRLAKDESRAARILLGAMSHDPVHGRSARELLRKMDEDPLLSRGPEMQRLRALKIQQNVAGWQGPEQMLMRLLERNRHNRMAFEYLMAYYTLLGRLRDFAANLRRLDDFDYESIPRHYEEAILLCRSVAGVPVDLNGRSISRETMERFYAFHETWSRSVGGDARAARALEDYNDTYFYYLYVWLPRIEQ